MKKVFDDVALYMMTVEKFFPDITGFIKTEYSHDIITVEVKRNAPKIKHIFQAKNYAQVFNAKYALLVTTKTISEERRRFVLKRPEIISRHPYDNIVLARFDEITKEFEINKDFYDGSLPEPFESHRKALDAEKLTVSKYRFNPIRIFVTNSGDRTIKIKKAKIQGSPSHSNLDIILNPKDSKWINLQKYVLWGMVDKPHTIELITELGKTFTFKPTHDFRIDETHGLKIPYKVI